MSPDRDSGLSYIKNTRSYLTGIGNGLPHAMKQSISTKAISIPSLSQILSDPSDYKDIVVDLEEAERVEPLRSVNVLSGSRLGAEEAIRNCELYKVLMCANLTRLGSRYT
jgi:hypothetical protein